MWFRDFQRDVAEILHVDVFIDDDDALGEHGLAQRPDRVHHLAGLSRVRLLDRDDHQVVEDAFDRQVDVHQLWIVSFISGKKMRSTALPM